MKTTMMNTAFYEWIKDEERFPNGTKGYKTNAENAIDWIKSLTEEIPNLVPNSTGLINDKTVPRRASFKLGDPRGKKDVTRPEDQAQVGIFLNYRERRLCGTEEFAFLTSIHSYQVPLAAKRGDKLGKIDLLGTTHEGLPAVIELKSTGKKPGRSAGSLLAPIIQGLAYALTIRHYWAFGLRDEWTSVAPGVDLPESLEGRSTPIIVASDHDFWNSSFRWERCQWSRFVAFSQALADANLPLFAARFEPGEKPMLEFAPFEKLIGHEMGSEPLGWPPSVISDSKPH